MKSKLKISMKIIAATKSKNHDDSNKVVIGKMKDETGSVEID